MKNLYERHVFDALSGRRSIRADPDRPVAHPKIVKLLQAAMAAPSACNIQPWEFVVVTDPERVGSIEAALAENGNDHAPLVIVVCGYMDHGPQEEAPR